VNLELDPAFSTATGSTMSRTAWVHHVTVAAVRNGVPAEWISENFAARAAVWFHAGETVGGAAEMLVFSWRQSAPERRAERELEHLRAFVRGARS
jgi:hypothetical protein